jgi:hypothetical protein
MLYHCALKAMERVKRKMMERVGFEQASFHQS